VLPSARSEINRGGLEMMYEIMFESSQREIGHVLQLVLDAAEAERPLLFYCAAGKDRTGMVAALLLSCCGASEEEIVADYIRWAELGGPAHSRDP
jgi:protein tyrosine/serine phosphatase